MISEYELILVERHIAFVEIQAAKHWELLGKPDDNMDYWKRKERARKWKMDYFDSDGSQLPQPAGGAAATPAACAERGVI